ncbi:hypothetical protein F2Q68_00010677 [Brassica cretica]|uniref:Uncharacterized protein n=1 Tax=Brassica cretica TaxID=69181 RepID=A0A8S9KSB8_BRACR|nr:hypothetical protein F2Q68_00010677 [Brassica cretica]
MASRLHSQPLQHIPAMARLRLRRIGTLQRTHLPYKHESASSLSCPLIQSYHRTGSSKNRETSRAISTPHPDKDITANLQHVSEIKFSTKQESIQHYNSDPSNTSGNQNNKPLLPNAPQKRFSFDEMQERKRKGLCMYCEEPFTPGHQLKHHRSELLLVEAGQTEFNEEIALEEQIHCTPPLTRDRQHYLTSAAT